MRKLLRVALCLDIATFSVAVMMLVDEFTPSLLISAISLVVSGVAIYIHYNNRYTPYP